MTIDEMIADFEMGSEKVPLPTVQWAVDNWDLAAPPLLDRLVAYVDGVDRSEATAELLFVALLVMGKRQERGTFAPLCRLIRDPKAIDSVLGGMTAETLTRILIGCFDGDIAPLRAVIEDPDIDGHARFAAIEAMSYLAATHAIPKDGMHAYMLDLFETLAPRERNGVWEGWIIAAARLGFADLAEKAHGVIRDGWLIDGSIDTKSFDTKLAYALADPDGMACFEKDDVKPFPDGVMRPGRDGEDASWDEAAEDDAFDAETFDALVDTQFQRLLARTDLKDITGIDHLLVTEIDAPTTEPVKNPLRNVGRNDPCPCGSGKKYKKCCLT